MKDQEAINKRLAELAKQNGVLTPAAVVEDAMDENSPLHEEFEWDPKKAAMSFWVMTARRIIKSYMVTVEIGKITVAARGYMRDPDSKANAQGYVSTAELRSDKDRAMRALVYELDMIDSYILRAKLQAAALGLEDEIELVATVVKRIKGDLGKTA